VIVHSAQRRITEKAPTLIERVVAYLIDQFATVGRANAIAAPAKLTAAPAAKDLDQADRGRFRR